MIKKNVTVVLIAGGKGTRISELYPDIPKPMIPVDGIPVLERNIVTLRAQGFFKFIMTIGYMADKIQNYFGDGSKWDVHISYFVEDTPLGNAGALFKLNLTDDFLLLNADVVFDVDFDRMLAYHATRKALVTLFTHPNSHPFDSGIIISDRKGEVKALLAKEDDKPIYYHNRVNAGLHIINPKALELSGLIKKNIGTESDGKVITVDLDRQILKPLCGKGIMFCYDSPEYVKDMGTPERYIDVCKDVKDGIVLSKNLRHKQKAIFLDRDGTINKYVGFLRKPEELKLTEDAAESIRLINSSGYLAIVVTNQPVIARGEVSVDGLDEIHCKLETELGKEGAYLDAIYYCPHHPDRGYIGEITELKIDCDCRKPKAGMLFNAAKDFNIDLESSYMIGDSDCDVLAGNAAGCKSIKIDEGGLLKVVREILK